MLNYRSFSQIILCGRLGQDAALRTTKTGNRMLSFAVGTSVSTKEADGTYSQATSWHDCIMFGPRVERLASALVKGTVVCVQGSLSYREVELKNGYKAKTANILVDDLQILAESKAEKSASQKTQSAEATQASEASSDEIPC